MIPDSFKQDLLNRVDIVDVISGRVQLRKSGANWVGLCPFHGEKTPSFTVSQSKQFYHCFGCGAHGNAIGFLMEYGGLGYIETLKELAEGVGLQAAGDAAATSGGAAPRPRGPTSMSCSHRPRATTARVSRARRAPSTISRAAV